MNLKGGYILLNLCAISLALSGEPVTITNANVLKKLSEFQMYVGTDEFKSQPKVGLKPVLVQYRSNVSKINGVILCKCGFDTNNKKLIISGTDGEKLSIQIECVFIDNPEDVKVTPYVLQSAKVTAYRGVIGDLDILGKLSVSGDVKIFENIVDSKGHNRFTEGDIELDEDIPEGFTKLYGKWSLSGSHLLIVLVIKGENGATLSSGQVAHVLLPQWIKDKIITIMGTSLVTAFSANWYDENLTTQNASGNFQKRANGDMQIHLGSVTLSSEKSVRIAIDLLIDNESEE